MTRLFSDPLPARLEWRDGELCSLRVADRRLVVVEIVRRWRVEGEWWTEGVARDYLTLRTADGLLVDVYHDRRETPVGSTASGEATKSYGDRRRGTWWLQRIFD